MQPLEATKASLDQRWVALTDAIRTELSLAPRVLQIYPEYVGESVWAGFVGQACETIRRQRGGPTPVVPIAPVGATGLIAWLGFQEVWEANQKRMHFSFRHVSLSVYFGYANDPIKPQVFRSEWSGIRDWTGGGFGFQSPGAGHPHWQFDLIDSLRDLPNKVDKALLELSETELPIEEFESVSSQPDVVSVIKTCTLDRMHFASAAPWWRPLDGTQPGHHMNAPSDHRGVHRWMLHCVAYVRQELARCELQR